MTALRRARAGDLEDLLAMNLRYQVDEGHLASPDAADTATRERARSGFAPLLAGDTEHDGDDQAGHIAAPGAVWIVTDDDGSAIGYAVLAWSWSVEIGGAEAVLDELYIETAHRRRGHGGRVLEQLAAIGRANHIRRIFMETEHRNTEARALYRRHGFVEETSIWMSRVL